MYLYINCLCVYTLIYETDLSSIPDLSSNNNNNNDDDGTDENNNNTLDFKLHDPGLHWSDVTNLVCGKINNNNNNNNLGEENNNNNQCYVHSGNFSVYFCLFFHWNILQSCNFVNI